MHLKTLLPFWLVASYCAFGNADNIQDMDIREFQELMKDIFMIEVGEDLKKKLEAISAEGVRLGKSNAEIEEMVKIRLNAQEKLRLRKAFQAISGPARQMASGKSKRQRPLKRPGFHRPVPPSNKKHNKSKEEL